jgi:hypothetical protein
VIEQRVKVYNVMQAAGVCAVQLVVCETSVMCASMCAVATVTQHDRAALL